MKYVLILLLAVGCSRENQAAEPKSPIEPLKNERFKVLQLSDMRRDQVLIDTATGKIWHKTCLVNMAKDLSACDYSAWMADDVEGITQTKTDIYTYADALEKSARAGK